jgi:hypothetical protein
VTGYIPFCCTLFAAGFALREYGAFDVGHINIYLASTLLIYMSPYVPPSSPAHPPPSTINQLTPPTSPILELANYHILGRTLYYVPYFSPIHPGRVLTTLGSLSAVVEVLNALGVAYLATSRTPDAPRYALGHDLMRASLALQLFVIALFYSLAGLFHRRCARAGTDHPRVRAVLYTLYVSMALILVRTVYRAVEHFGAPLSLSDGGEAWRALSPVIRYEWFFWVFEASPMLVNAVMWNVRHPRKYLPESYKLYLAQDGETEWEGPGWGDKRNVVMTLVDPFGFLAMCEKGRRGEPFWQGNGYQHLLGGKGRQEAV